MTSRVATDIGGTFTDLVELDEATGALTFAKSSTTHRRTTIPGGVNIGFDF